MGIRAQIFGLLEQIQGGLQEDTVLVFGWERQSEISKNQSKSPLGRGWNRLLLDRCSQMPAKRKGFNRPVRKTCVRRCFRRELTILWPRYILALGPDVYYEVSQFEVLLAKRGTQEIKFMLHPSPFNGHVPRAYPDDGWVDIEENYGNSFFAG